MVFKSIIGTTCACLAAVSFSADAAFLSRLGGQAYYDDVADLTWLADANAAGSMTWVDANNWAANLDIDGVTGWRLPTTMQPDASCSFQSNQGASFPLQGSGFGCTGSEMGNLFNVEDISAAAPGPFSNVQSNGYWSGTEFAPITSLAWGFFFNDGSQSPGAGDKGNFLFAWAVQSGDVSAVPVPAAVWLFGSGLIGLMGVARRRKTTI